MDSTPQPELNDLPESSSEFWDGEKIRIELAEPKVKFADQPHYFERVKGHQAYCSHCSYGFELDPGDEIRDGHLFDTEGNLII
jgi:hypothetical protein